MTIMKKKKTTKNGLMSCLPFAIGVLLLVAILMVNGILSSDSISKVNSSASNRNSNRHDLHHRAHLSNPMFSKEMGGLIDPLLAGDSTELIQKGYLHLIDVRVKRNPFTNDENENGKESQSSPYRAFGRFCHLEWSKHKADPSSVPMFKDLVQRSPECTRTSVTLDLYSAVVAAREYDKQHGGKEIKSMLPRGFVFHESRCGSTLVANSLAAFEPSKNRVYSESDPPISVANVFDLDYEAQSIQLLQDTIYLMGRTSDVEEDNLFYKIQSIGSKSIWAFRKGKFAI